ncbi:MAG: translation initiation factor IF-2 [Candidatus Paceibacterota bacterium]|jgi:translation initiation factor IF-2
MKQSRPPIVVVMGHVDHGKTTLLDHIRKTTVASKEAGGITQSIGAYEIEHTPAGSKEAKRITFIDTPGHEAFSKMRERGAKIADLAILVVAADDSVKPQTKNALKYIQEEKVPFIVAINKIDKPGADIEKVVNDLMQLGIYLEGKGGDVSWHAVSAKTGEGVSELLDLILLTSELEDIHCVGDNVASGVVVSVRMDSKRGLVAGVIIKEGVLMQGYAIATHSTSGKVRTLENFMGKAIQQLEPSAPALIIGFEKAPQIGEIFCAHKDEKVLHESLIKLEKMLPNENKNTSFEKGEKRLAIVLKADEAGTLEVLNEVMGRLAKTLPLAIVKSSVGPVTEGDVKDADSMKAAIIGFHTKMDRAAENMALAKKILFFTSPIIYELEKQVAEHAKKLITKEFRTIDILGVFGGAKGKERVVGGRVTLGPIKNHEPFEIWYETKLIGKGKILNLQSGRKDIAEAETGIEVGLLVESDDPIRVGNRLVFEYS